MTIRVPLPVDVDVATFDFFPIYWERLRRSRAWLRAKRRPALGFYAINLWFNAIGERPAGSFDADDDVLADKAMCHPRDWAGVKDELLIGWVLGGDGRLHHPVVCEIVWGLWQARLKARYDRTCDSWRGQVKRAQAAGKPPPAGPGSFTDWLAREQPATHAYIYSVSADCGPASAGDCEKSGGHLPKSTGRDGGVVRIVGQNPATIGEHPATAHGNPDDIRENPPDISPKRSEAKLTPPYPPGAPGGRERAGPRAEGREGAESRENDGTAGLSDAAFAAEYGRLERAFGPDAMVFQANVQRPGESARGAFVRTFRGAVVERFDTGGGVIEMPTRRSAGQLMKVHGEWLKGCGWSIACRTKTGRVAL